MTHDLTRTPWSADESLTRTTLDASVSSDVCVVGAGVAGLSTAYLLQRDGRSVVVVDSGTIGGGQTGRTTAHLASAIDDRFVELERLHGAEGARGAAASHAAAIDRIEASVHEEGLDCGFARVDGYLFDPGARAPGSDDRLLRDEHDAAHRAGLEVELVARAPIASFDTGRCLRFARQARVEPLRYLDGLARAFERQGGRIFTGTRAAQIAGGSSAHVATVAGHRVSAAAVVVATNSPINDLFALHAKQAPYTSYAITARVPRGAVPDVLLWDTEDPYHYVRLQPGGGAHHDLLIIGGEDHKTGHANDGAERFARLQVWARDRFPAIASVEHRWSGQVLETSDGVAFIGRNPGDDDNVYVVSGDSGHGMTHGTIAGMLVCDLVAGRASPWQALYDPARIRLGAAGDLVRENLDVARTYLSWLTPGEVSTADEIRPGDGAVLREGLAKIAAYRDDDGILHRRSAVCPHLGCLVAWNAVERTWDCPCHGSRFDCAGRVVNGPANRDLAEAD
jgi:glycine/D-amino acid oxidase-like deaminating enzyme/nitrite reductase/ring-hydroxylating ferredoxin subunit